MADPQHGEEHEYHPQDAIAPTLRSTAITGGAGALFAAMQATLTKRNIGMMGAFTQHGGVIGVLAAMGGTYEFGRIAAANLRQKNDSYNEAIGGFLSGAIAGLRHRTIPAMLGYGAALSIIMSTLDYTGGSLRGFAKDPNVDEYERKEALRANKRRPIQETISELGEGRGIYGPGYEERRRERLKQSYGIDLPAR